eukprot:scaffold6009_cov248-Pinguiococcus_pyrenoidosus.AAC.5
MSIDVQAATEAASEAEDIPVVVVGVAVPKDEQEAEQKQDEAPKADADIAEEAEVNEQPPQEEQKKGGWAAGLMDKVPSARRLVGFAAKL